MEKCIFISITKMAIKKAQIKKTNALYKLILWNMLVWICKWSTLSFESTSSLDNIHPSIHSLLTETIELYNVRTCFTNFHLVMKCAKVFIVRAEIALRHLCLMFICKLYILFSFHIFTLECSWTWICCNTLNTVPEIIQEAILDCQGLHYLPPVGHH